MNAVTGIGGFIGTWLLMPDLCRYAFGKPPVAGRYVIAQPDHGEVSLESEWVSASGRRHVLRFTGPVDGRPHPLHGSRIADAIRIDYLSAQRLGSSAWREGRKVMWAERVLLAPDRLQIDMHGWLASGDAYSNIDIYRRE